jgi:hypothetical protein
MGLKPFNYIVELVTKHPGEYTPADLIKKLRLYAINIGAGDIGLANARNFFTDAIGADKICVRDETTCWGTKKRNRCYPK